ncbi:glyoxylate reductase [Aaosphaeria arxii CBS 175.79]|uniref:Glyoxylate reductase n=1 Tax=Aaosphaeria arxii CBS 175.79 TaxID=1450172 RepID=A0A6A5Y1J2_9PLEO|nr:glyoxylate reductase [Aaosphaeria arxii CBS 175.79]KAF2018700.1 glyoxylate reductase [Aaosphaeria arxii CBS 175.79]
MTKPHVLLLGEILRAHEAWESLSSLAEIVSPKAQDRTEFLEECRNGAFDKVLVIYRTFESVALTGCFDEELVRTLPDSVQFICHNGAGYDQIDISACTARGIRVSNTPTAVNDSTADLNLFLILGALRGFNASMISLREGKWRGYPPPPPGHDPTGKILGILGMGGIGRNLKKKAEAFSMKVIYHNRNKLDGDLAGGAEYVSFEELLKKSDIISLNLPLNEETRHKISVHELAMMKKGVVIVNTARGAVIDEKALVNALDRGHVASVGLDVYENEPEVHPGLVANPNVLLVPHLGTYTVETQRAMEDWNISNVRSVLESGALRNVVPEQIDL